MNTCKLIAWAQSRYNTNRFTADTIHTYYVARGIPARLAAEIDSDGNEAVERLIADGTITAEPANQMFGGENSRVTVHHGVTVVYPNGRKRTIRA